MRAALLVLLALHAALAAPVYESLISQIPDLDEDDDPAEDEVREGHGEWEHTSFREGPYYYDQVWDEPSEEEVGAVFASIDANQDGKLSAAELRSALSRQMDHFIAGERDSAVTESAAIVAEADADLDGKLSQSEFEAASSLFLRHEGALDRAALFSFADGGGGGGDGHLDAAELQLLVFPEFSERAADFREFLAQHAIRTHDSDGDERLDPAELFSFHELKLLVGGGHAKPGISVVDGGGGGADDEAGGWAEQRQARPYGFDDEAWDNEEWRGGLRPREDEYAEHNVTFEWHDRDGDGVLDAVELQDYMVPLEPIHAGYVEEELRVILKALRNPQEYERAERAAAGGGHEGGQGGGPHEEEAEFSLEHVMQIAGSFVGTFEHFSRGGALADEL